MATVLITTILVNFVVISSEAGMRQHFLAATMDFATFPTLFICMGAAPFFTARLILVYHFAYIFLLFLSSFLKIKG